MTETRKPAAQPQEAGTGTYHDAETQTCPGAEEEIALLDFEVLFPWQLADNEIDTYY